MPKNRPRTRHEPIFFREEKKVLFDLLEKYYDAAVSSHSSKASSWITITEEYNSLVIRPRSRMQLQRCWGSFKESLHKKLSDGGLKTIASLTPLEIKGLLLIPNSYFRDLFNEKDFVNSLEEASNGKSSKSNVIDTSDDANYEIVLENNGQNTEENEESLSDSSIADYSSVDDQNSITDVQESLNTTANIAHQEIFDTNFYIKEEIMDCDENIGLEGIPDKYVATDNMAQFKTVPQLNISTTFQSSRCKTYKREKMTVDEEETPDSFFLIEGTEERSSVISEETSTMPSIVNVQSLTNSQFNQAEQDSSHVTNLDIATQINSIPNSAKQGQTNPYFPNAIFEFDHTDSSQQPVYEVTIDSSDRSSSKSPEPHSTSNVMFSGKGYVNTRMKMELNLFRYEMDYLHKERECISRKHQSKMALLRSDLKLTVFQYEELKKMYQKSSDKAGFY